LLEIRTRDQSFFSFSFLPPPSPDVMVDDLAGDEDGVAGHDVVVGDKKRTSPEPETARLAAASPAKARKETKDFFDS
jgi:hypothetical protein